jgi:hypothetical protein
MLKHDRPVEGCVGSAVGSVVGGILRRRRSRQVKSDLGLAFDLSTYTIFGVLILIMYLIPTGIVGGASLAPRG